MAMLSTVGEGMTSTPDIFVPTEHITGLLQDQPPHSVDDAHLSSRRRPRSAIFLDDMATISTPSKRIQSEADILREREGRQDRTNSLNGVHELRDFNRMCTIQHLWWHERQRQINAANMEGVSDAEAMTDDEEDNAVWQKENMAVEGAAVVGLGITTCRGMEPSSASGQRKWSPKSELLHKHHWRHQVSHGDVFSMPGVSGSRLEYRRRSAPDVNEPGHGHTGFEHFKDVLFRRKVQKPLPYEEIQLVNKQGKAIPEIRTPEEDNDPHSKPPSGFSQFEKSLTSELMRKNRGHCPASHGNVMSLLDVPMSDLGDRRLSAPSIHGDQHAPAGFEHFKDILLRRKKAPRPRSLDITSSWGKTMPEFRVTLDNEDNFHAKGSTFSQIKKSLTPELLRKNRGRRQASLGDVMSLPEVSSASAVEGRWLSALGIQEDHGDRYAYPGFELVKDILHRRTGFPKMYATDFQSSLPTGRIPEIHDDQLSQLSGEHGTPVSELVADVAMEQRLTSYRVHLASTKAILNLEADCLLLDGDEILLEDGDDEGIGDPRSEADARLRNVYRMLKTEKRYQEALRSIFDVYAEPLRKFSSLTKDNHRVLFFGLEPLLSLSASLVLKLEDSIQQWDDAATVGNHFSKQFWHHYDEYYHNYKDIRSLLKEKREKEEEFVQFCQLRRGAARHSLDSLLLLPVQRIPAYAGYLTELLEDTDRSHPDYDDLSKATTKVKSMIKEREDDLNVAENELKVETVQDRFPDDDLGLRDREKYMKMKALQSRRRSAPGAMILRSLSKKQGSGSNGGLSPLLPDLANASRTCTASFSRVYILEGPAQLTTGLQTQDRYLFLFNDLLLVAKQKSSTTFKLKQRTRVCEMWMANCLDEVAETSRSADRSFVIGWPTTNMVATFTTQEIRELWYTKLKEQISLEKGKEAPKTVILRIRNNDMEEYPTSKSLAVTNYEQAHEVVKRCMEEFHITDGKPKDYQLWVLSGKEESPYPLIGHEQPYSIKMSHMRDAARGPDDSPIDVDANDNSIRCQLVLRQAKKDPKNTLDEPGIKRNKKSKKSPLINFFKKSMKHDSPPAAPPLGKLFGRSLCEVSEEDAIPKPIMAMLHQLFLSGPYTTGIFRKTANQRCIREMREKLDNGEDVNFEQTPVLSIAGIFKEFLRSLPDCLFLSDMYDSWLDILEIQDNQQRVEKVKKTLEQLPKPHVNLLRYIMCMLYHIEVRSESNSMNASNLAICIGQSLLFLPTSSGTPNQTGTKRVTELIQFIIESSIDVFGEDVTMLFGEAPDTKPRQDSSTDSDSMHSLLSLADNNGPRRDDSSLDSLDRDLYNSEIESSPRLLKSHMSNTNLSRDSGLTLSDTQLYTDDCSEGNEYPRILVGGSPQKHHHQQHFMRSVSQIEEHHHHQKMIPAEMLSRSCGDGTLDLADHAPPVPPPRKSRPRRGAETPPGEQSPPGLPGGLQGVTMRHSQSMSQMSPPGYNSRHPKADMSLEDLDENLVAEEYTEIQRIVHDQDEGSILHKSESGACLFMNDEVVHRGLPEKQQIYVGQDTSPAQPSWGEMSDDSPMRSLPDLSGSYGDIAGSPITSPLGMDLSASYPNVFTNTLVESTEVHHPVVIPDHPPPPYNANHKTVPTPSQKRPTQEGSLEPSPPLPPRPTTLVLQHQQTPLSHHSKESFTSPPSSQHSKQLGGKILHNQFQKDPTILRKVQKGMTPTGADIFPKHMRSMMRHSLQEEEMRKAVQTKEKMPVHKVVSDTQSLQHSESQAECRKIVMQMYKSRSVEKSASDSNILDTFQPSQESTPRKSSDSAIERQRPNKPPSYQEAIKRKSLIQSGALRYEASETELIEQRANNQRARQLYEDSMKRYMEENNEDTRSNTLEDSQSGESSASQGAAEQIYETMMYMPEKSETEAQQPDQQLTESPEMTKWQKDNSIHVCQDRLQDQPQEQDMHIDNRDLPLSNSRQGALLMQSNGINCISHSVHRQQYSHSQDLPLKRDSESHESTPVRSNHSHERTSRENRNNNQNERPKSRSKSRDKRHGHRSSDTRLENSRSKDDREFRYLRSNLSRSKSDSQEHLNKIAHFKELKPLDNNIIEKCKRAKIDSFSRTLAHQSNESPRSRNQSVKNKEWHRQLAEKYNQVFYQPPSVQQKKSVPQYAYIKSTKQEANKNERPKRRWTRPVHPSKDLIINNDVEVRTRKNTPPRTIVKSENDFRNGQQYENSRKNMVAEKENRPAVVSVSEPVAPQTQTECSEFLEHSKDFTMAEPDTISWSVARLRNLYDDSKSEGGSKGPQGPFYSPEHEGSRPPPPPYRHPPAANRTTTIQHSPNEKTNPEAEESYV